MTTKISNLAPEAAEEVRRFAAGLRIARRVAGGPSLRAIEAGCAHELSYSTIRRLLQGVGAPTWSNTRVFLGGLGLDSETIEKVWLPRWLHLQEIIDPVGAVVALTLPGPALEGGEPGCARCGAVVADQARHAQWHEQIEAPSGRLRAITS